MKTLIALLAGLMVISTACMAGAVQELPDTVRHVLNYHRTSHTYYLEDYTITFGVVSFDGYWLATSKGVPQAYIWVDEGVVLSGDWMITTAAVQR